MCYHPHSSGRALNEFLKSRYLNAERDRTCWESIPGMMKELWWKKAGVEANAGPHGAMQRRQEKRSEKEKWAAGRQRLSDWGCELMKKGSDLSGSVGTETSLHLNAPMEETRPYRAPSQSFVPNLQFPILSGWAAALNFNEEKLKILPLPIFPLYSTLSSVLCPSIFTRLAFSDLVLEEVFRLFMPAKVQRHSVKTLKNPVF